MIPPATFSPDPGRRVDDRIAAWGLVVDRVAETEGAILAFGHRGGDPVVLKVLKNAGDEWRCGEILAAFNGRGVVRLYDHVEGAILLECLTPGTTLVDVAIRSDEEATAILADVVAKMAPRDLPSGVPTVGEWGHAFERHVASGNTQIPRQLLREAQRVYRTLADSQARPRLLHGDLHHRNVLFDSARGWVAIDPKGVVGELEFEIGAALRNPYEHPHLFADPLTLARRVELFTRRLQLDGARTKAWCFAQAVLAAVWAIEDGAAIEANHGWIALATAIRPDLRLD